MTSGLLNHNFLVRCLCAVVVANAILSGNAVVASERVTTTPDQAEAHPASVPVGVRAAVDTDEIIVPAGPLETPVAPPPAHLRTPVRQTAQALIVDRGRFRSVQVNVNAKGDDIVGDAANEPSMAVDPTDRSKIAIGWRQFDTIANNFRQAGISYSQDGGQTWTFPGVLDPGQFRSDPVLASDANGVFYYSSLSSLTSIEVFRSDDGGVTWSAPVAAFGGDKQWIAVDATAGIGSGHAYQIWNVQFSCCPPADFTRTTNGGASFGGPFALPLPSMKWGTLSVGPDGELYSAAATLNQTGHLITKSTTAQNPALSPTWGPVVSVNLGGTTSFGTNPNPQGLLGQVWVATDHSAGATRGNVYMLGSVNPAGSDPLDVHFVRSEDGGTTWSAPVRVNDDPGGTNAYQWFGTMAVAPNGRIDVVWYDTKNDAVPSNPTTSEVYYTFSLDAGVTWSPSEPISPAFNHTLGYPQQDKLGDYIQLISFDDLVYLAYAATFTGGQDVYFMSFPPTCGLIGCGSSLEPLASGAVDNNRYLSIVPRNEAGMTALRVQLSNLPPPLEGFEGEFRWVGDPQLVWETLTGATFFMAAPLVCDPVYRDWGSEGLIHVYSVAVVPGAEYGIQAIDEACDPLEDCSFSPQLLVTTQKWGDVIEPFGGGGQPSFEDISAVVNKFRNLPGAVLKVQADLHPVEPDQVVDFIDISADVDAFRGMPYPSGAPSACP